MATCFTFTISDCVCTDSAHCPYRRRKECDQNQQDSLHGVLSRTSGLERLTHIEACQQTEHVHLLALLDIDQLRQFNERHGYERGDIALQNTINTLLHQLRAKEFVCRLGDDEFLVVMPNCRRTLSETRLFVLHHALMAKHQPMLNQQLA